MPDDRTALAELRTPAPRGLGFSVLERVGIVDTYDVAEYAPLGPVCVAVNGRGVSRVDDEADPDAFEESFRRHFGRPARRGPLPSRVLRALERGDGRGLEVDLRSVPAFERSALEAARTIPFGEVRSYTWVAHQVGRDRAVRAVGSAMARNPVPLLVPCHRVVRGDGRIGEYGLGGPAVKRRLLEHEGLDPDALERLAARGTRLLGSATTGVACVPSCHAARRVAARHRREFATPAQALAAGMRPCARCRPFSAA